MGAIRTLHAWAGTALSILAMVFGLTGSLLVFEDDWIRATVPAARAEIDLDAARLGAALDRLEAAEPRLTSVVLPGGAVGVHRLYLADDGFDFDHFFETFKNLFQVVLDVRVIHVVPPCSQRATQPINGVQAGRRQRRL